MLQSGTCMFYVRGCSVSLNLNFCGTTNVNELNAATPRPLILMRCCRTRLQVISLRHGPQFRDEEGYTLWQRCIADVERVQHELKASGLDDASCQHILTAQCALLDEAVKGRGVEDEACLQWYDIPLQGHFHHGRRRHPVRADA